MSRMMFPIGATWGSGQGLAAPPEKVDFSLLWENLFSPENRVDRGLHGSAVLTWFWDLAPRVLLNRGVITSKEWENLTNIARMGFGVDMKGLPLIILDEARTLGQGRITMESLARVKGSPVYQRALIHHLNSLQNDYNRKRTEEYLEEFFAVVEARRDLEEDFLSQDISIIDDRFKEHMFYNFSALRISSTFRLVSEFLREQEEKLLQVLRAQEGGTGAAAIAWEQLKEVSTDERLHEALAEYSPGYLTGKQLLNFTALVEEYNWEWALASFQWGPESLL